MRRLTDEQLREIRDVMVQRILEGLAADGREIKALDAQLPAPPSDLTGRALVMDIGGTNMRSALVEIASGRPTIVRGPLKARLELREEASTKTEFFRAQAKLVKALDPEPGLPVGYCFSYPSDILPSLDARLIRWTKGITVAGVEGSLVGTGLREALEDEGLAPRCVHVLNDTVASMLGGALDVDGPGTNVIGLIAGTGSNMSAFFDPASHAKLKGHTRPVAINLESGNFRPPYLTEADDAVDRASTNPGAQRFEKAIAGYYLPFLYEHLRPGVKIDETLGSGALVRMRDEDDDELAATLLARAADLIAVGLAAVATAQGGSAPVAVLAEGSLFWGDPKMRPDVDRRLAQLVDRAHEIRRLEDANLIGSACAALYVP